MHPNFRAQPVIADATTLHLNCHRAWLPYTDAEHWIRALLQGMLQVTNADQLHRSTEHCYRACYDTTSLPYSEKALLQSMLHSSTPNRFSFSEDNATPWQLLQSIACHCYFEKCIDIDLLLLCACCFEKCMCNIWVATMRHMHSNHAATYVTRVTPVMLCPCSNSIA